MHRRLKVMAITSVAAAMLGALCARALGWLPGGAVFWLVSGLTTSLGALIVKNTRGWIAPAWLAAACWGALLGGMPDEVAVAHGGLARASFEVARGGCGERGCFADAVLLACHALEEGACVAHGSRLGVASERELPAGARITALVHIHQRARFDNPGDVSAWPDTRAPLSASVQRAAAPRVDQLSWLGAQIAGARVHIRALLERTLRAPHAGIARALLLGEGSAVAPELNDAIRNAGVSHVLAVSGMHVTLLVGAWVIAVRRLWLFTPWAAAWEARRVGAAVGVVLAPLLSRLCGASPSAARAAWTSMLMYLITAFGLRPSAASVSALIVAGFAALEPREALHPGFMLSVLATAALLSDSPREAKAGLLALGARALRTSVRAWLATTPFLLLCFGQLSLIPVLANVALLPLGEALVPLAALHLLGAALDVLPTGALFSLADGAFVEAARLCAALDPGLVLPPPTPLQAIAWGCIALCWLVPLGWRAQLSMVAAGVAVLAGAEWMQRHALAPGALRVTFLDVGQGDATLLESEGQAMLIDAGGAIGPGPDPGALSVLPALRARRISKLDRVVLSHPHPDHYGGLRAVLDALPVHELWDNGQAEAESDHGPVLELLAAARARGTLVRAPSTLCGRALTLGRAQLEVLAPCPGFDFTREANDNSFVLRVTHGRMRFLLTGDVEREAEADLVARGVALRSEVLKVGHHGSRSSSTQAFLAAVAPTLAVISAGRGNQFGHPHAEVVERLGKRLLRTDLDGGIEFLSDGSRVRFRTAHDPRWRPP